MKKNDGRCGVDWKFACDESMMCFVFFGLYKPETSTWSEIIAFKNPLQKWEYPVEF